MGRSGRDPADLDNILVSSQAAHHPGHVIAIAHADGKQQGGGLRIGIGLFDFFNVAARFPDT
jgi:hypothetical protein